MTTHLPFRSATSALTDPALRLIPWLQEAIAHFYPNSEYAASLDPEIRGRAANRLFLTPKVGASAICPYCSAPNAAPEVDELFVFVCSHCGQVSERGAAQGAVAIEGQPARRSAPFSGNDNQDIGSDLWLGNRRRPTRLAALSAAEPQSLNRWPSVALVSSGLRIIAFRVCSARTAAVTMRLATISVGRVAVRQTAMAYRTRRWSHVNQDRRFAMKLLRNYSEALRQIHPESGAGRCARARGVAPRIGCPRRG